MTSRKTSRKPYYEWLQLYPSFFTSLPIKKLRKAAGGDTYTIIFQKLMLLSINTEGCLDFAKIEKTFEDELALVLDEDVDNVKMTMAFILQVGLAEKTETGIFMPRVIELTSKKDDSSIRVANFRKNQKEKLQQTKVVLNPDAAIEYSPNNPVTERNALHNVTGAECNASIYNNLQSITITNKLPSDREQAEPVDNFNRIAQILGACPRDG